jgi:hypothetical protein
MTRRAVWAPLTAFLFILAGCDGLFDIENPGEILDSDLNDPDLVAVLITGLSSDVSDFVDDAAFDVARLSDELAGSGSYADTGYFRIGWAEQDEVNNGWEQAHEAIWMAQLHVERIQEMLEPADFSANDDVARAWIFQGVSHRALGELYCQVVYSEPEEYGTLQPKTVAFDSARSSFTRALNQGSGAYSTAAHAGLASVYAALGQWDQAAAEAALVPDDFEFLVYYDDNDNDNVVYVESHRRAETSVFQTYSGSFTPPDPRAPHTKCDIDGGCVSVTGADGVTTAWRQDKFDDIGSEIVALSGKEARLIRAEAALQPGGAGIIEFATHINAVRDMYGLDPIDPTGLEVGALEYPNAYDDALSILDAERHLTLWLEGRRLFDLHRWNHPFLNGGTVVWDGEPRRDSCMPVPQGECGVNPNFTCTEAAAGTISGGS